MKFTKTYEMAEKILIEENGIYGIDVSAASWATDQINAEYHKAEVQLKDADFVIEDDQNLLVVEYKNANIPGAAHPERFHPEDTKRIDAVIRKFYDTLHYLHLKGKNRAVYYVYIVEAPNSDETTRKRLRNRMKSKLPFQLQKNIGNGHRLIDGVAVVSISEWNEHPVLKKFPLRLVGSMTSEGVDNIGTEYRKLGDSVKNDDKK